jgi:hypothetical protein
MEVADGGKDLEHLLVELPSVGQVLLPRNLDPLPQQSQALDWADSVHCLLKGSVHVVLLKQDERLVDEEEAGGLGKPVPYLAEFREELGGREVVTDRWMDVPQECRSWCRHTNDIAGAGLISSAYCALDDFPA